MRNDPATQAACLLADRFHQHSQQLCAILAPIANEDAPYPFEAVNEWSRGTVAIRDEAVALIAMLRDAKLREVLREIVTLSEKTVDYLRQKNH